MSLPARASPVRRLSPPMTGCAPLLPSPSFRNSSKPFANSKRESSNWKMGNDKTSDGRRRVAYLNEDFLNSPDARAIRMLAEYLEPLSIFRKQKIRDTVVFFGSARVREDGPLGEYYVAARALAARLTKWAEQFANSTYR